MIDLQYRGTNERIWIKAEGKERCTVVFSVQFKDPDDIVIGKTFLQVRYLSSNRNPFHFFVYKI
jgi:hypothetical protein